MKKHFSPSPARVPTVSIWTWPAYFLTLTAIIVIAAWGSKQMGYDWDWEKIPIFFYDPEKNKIGPILLGLAINLKITGISFVLTSILGLATAVARLSGGPILRFVATLYLEIIRNTPLMVQLPVVYFIFGQVFEMPRFWAATLALSLFEGAYLSEIIRSGLLAVSEGQWQASWCLGLSTPQTFRYVILPQTAPMLLPPLASLSISLVKDSALVSVIGLGDLALRTRSLVSETFLSFELWLVASALFLALNLGLSAFGTFLEKRFKH